MENQNDQMDQNEAGQNPAGPTEQAPETTHVVTSEDLQVNPELADAGVQENDEIQIPEEAVAKSEEMYPSENSVKLHEVDVNHFITNEIGTLYGLPVYHIVEGIGIQPLMSPDKSQYILPLPFVRGSKLPGGEEVEKKEGIVHEALIGVIKADLEYKSSLVPSDETAAILVHIEAIQDLMAARARKRKEAGTQGTMQK